MPLGKLVFAQLSFGKSLRDIRACLAAPGRWLYRKRLRSPVTRNALFNANAVQPWQIRDDLAQHLIGVVWPLYARDPIGVDLKETVEAFDWTAIDLCLSVYPQARFRSTRTAIKLHILLDARGAIARFVHFRAKRRCSNPVDRINSKVLCVRRPQGWRLPQLGRVIPWCCACGSNASSSGSRSTCGSPPRGCARQRPRIDRLLRGY